MDPSSLGTVDWAASEEEERHLHAIISLDEAQARSGIKKEIWSRSRARGKGGWGGCDENVGCVSEDGGGQVGGELDVIREGYTKRVGRECAMRMSVCPEGSSETGRSADEFLMEFSRQGWVGGCAHAVLHLGANPTTRDAKGDTALHVAAGQGHSETCQVIIEMGGDAAALNGDGLTPALLAHKRVCTYTTP